MPQDLSVSLRNGDSIKLKAFDNEDGTYSLAVAADTSKPLATMPSKNELGYDAWGRNKVVNDKSLLHGMLN